MKKTMNYLLGGVAVLSAAAIATSVSIFAVNKNVNVQNDSILANSNSNNEVAKNSQKISEENKELSNEVTKLNGISFSDFQIDKENLSSIRNLTQNEIFESLVAKAYSVKNSNSFKYEIVDFKNNLTNKTISFKIRVSNSENEKEYLDTNLYTISWTLDKKGEIINELSFEELEGFVNDSRYIFGEYNNHFKDIVFGALSSDRNFDINAEFNYYDTNKGKFVSEAETSWLDKRNLIKVNTETGINFTIEKKENEVKKFLYRGEILTFDRYFVNNVTITGTSLLDSWLTKTVSKRITNDWRFVCSGKEISKTTLEAERINSVIDRRVMIQDMNIPREMFNSDLLIINQGSKLVSYGDYFLSSNKGMEKHLLDPTITQLIMDNLEFNDGFAFDHTQFDYKFISMRDYKIIAGDIIVNGQPVEIINKVLVNTDIEITSKATGQSVKTEPLNFSIVVKDYDLFNNRESMLDRMGLGLLNDGTYSLTYTVNPNNSFIEDVEIPKWDRNTEDRWFFDLWQQQQKDLLKNKFGIANPNVEPIIYRRSTEVSNKINVELLMDKSKGTFEDTFKAVYGVDYQETIKRLKESGRGTEAAILKNIQKIQVFGAVEDLRSERFTQYDVVKEIVYRTFTTTSSRIYLDQNETIGFGAKDTDQQIYQSATTYKWRYKARK